MDRIERLPLFPLHAVLFPGATLALKVFEARYLDLVSQCLRRAEPFGVCLIRAGEEVGAPAEPHELGTLAHIGRWEMDRPGVLLIEVRGGARFAVERVWQEGKRTWASAWPIEEAEADVPPELESLADLFMRMRGEETAGREPGRAAGPLGWALAAGLPLPDSAKFALLGENDPVRRLVRIAEALAASGEPKPGPT